MAIYKVKIVGAARRQIRKLSKETRKRILDKIEKLSENPRPQGCRQLQAEDNLFRVRVGDYRVVYEIRDVVLIILILRVGHRREIYR